MPAFLDSRDLRLLIGAGVLMIVLVAIAFAVGPAPSQQSIGFPSSYSSQWAGTKAAFVLLQQQGYRVERWEKSPEDLPENSDGAVLIFAEPSESASNTEREAIRRFVAGGGRVLAMGASAADLAPDVEAVPVESSDLKPKVYPALLPSPITRDAPEVAMVAPDSFTSSSHPWLALYGQDEDVAAVSYPVGKGEVIWWASPSPVENGTIREKSNLAFFLNCVGAPSDAPVYWDEYFHGDRASLASYFAHGPLPWAGLQIGIAFIAVLFTFSRRSGAIRLPATESRLSPLEFVDTLGDLYQSAQASPAAVGVSYKRFRLALSRKLAAAPGAKLPEICRAAAARFGWPEDALLDTLSRSERAMRSINPNEAEALYLVRQLHEYSDRLEPHRRNEQEKPAWR
jgi:Domain of unknown function (DUF4350)